MKAILTITLSLFLISCSTGPEFIRTQPLEAKITNVFNEDTISIKTSGCLFYYKERQVSFYFISDPIVNSISSRSWTLLIDIGGPEVINDVGESAWFQDSQDLLLPGIYVLDSLSNDDDTKATADIWFDLYCREEISGGTFPLVYIGETYSKSILTVDSVYKIHEYYYVAGKIEGVVKLANVNDVNLKIDFSTAFTNLQIKDFIYTN